MTFTGVQLSASSSAEAGSSSGTTPRWLVWPSRSAASPRLSRPPCPSQDPKGSKRIFPASNITNFPPTVPLSPTPPCALCAVLCGGTVKSWFHCLVVGWLCLLLCVFMPPECCGSFASHLHLLLYGVLVFKDQLDSGSGISCFLFFFAVHESCFSCSAHWVLEVLHLCLSIDTERLFSVLFILFNLPFPQLLLLLYTKVFTKEASVFLTVPPDAA